MQSISKRLADDSQGEDGGTDDLARTNNTRSNTCSGSSSSSSSVVSSTCNSHSSSNMEKLGGGQQQWQSGWRGIGLDGHRRGAFGWQRVPTHNGSKSINGLLCARRQL